MLCQPSQVLEHVRCYHDARPHALIVWMCERRKQSGDKSKEKIQTMVFNENEGIKQTSSSDLSIAKVILLFFCSWVRGRLKGER